MQIIPQTPPSPARTFRSTFLLMQSTDNALIQMAVAHDLACVRPGQPPQLTMGARVRLLNVGFTHDLRSLVKRGEGNPFTEADLDTPRSMVQTFYKQLVSDQPNAIQELFIKHLDDLYAYLEASALPRATFLYVCGLFVIDAQKRRSS